MGTEDIKTIHSVAAAFCFIDDFTGKPINDSIVSFFIDDRRVSAIRKAGGIYVLTDLSLENANISIQSPNFCTYVIEKFVYTGNMRNDRIHTIRLHPGVNYPLKNGTTAYSAQFITQGNHEGLADTTIRILAPFCNNSIKFKAMKTIGGIHIVSLSNPRGLDLTGLTLAAAPAGEGKLPVFFEINKKIDNMTFEAALFPEKILLQEESVLKRVYSSITNNHGQILIPMDMDINKSSNNSGGDCKKTVELYADFASNGTVFKEIQIKTGGLTHFTEEINGENFLC